ncbi:MAG: transcriptional repressor [Bryobacteraceae bacterium]|nr:transcriptional repressor [Bryobacteraceae bacterium]
MSSPAAIQVATQSRNTRQRKAIRDAFTGSGRPMNPAEVLAIASQSVSGIGIATVYRTIKGLLEDGWLVTVDLPGQVSRYEQSGKGHHHHFHCRDCDKVFEMNGCPGHEDEGPDGFVVTGHEFVLYGYCDSCAQARHASTQDAIV